MFISMLISFGHLLKGDLSSSHSVVLLPTISPVESQPMATDDDLIHCIILFADRVLVNINAIEKDLPYAALSTFVQKHHHQLNQQKLSIAVSKETHYTDVIKVVDLMASFSIKQYQLVRYD
jgi:biopolymer transport protein ExbD